MSGSIPQTGGAENRLTVSRATDAVLIQVNGLGNMFLAPTLQSFVESELKADFRRFIVDLRKCDGMDSTFMGTFIGLSVKVKTVGGWFCLVNVSEENLRLLKMLGVLNLVSVHKGDFPTDVKQSSTLYPTTDSFARHKQMYSAHRLLIEADPENEKLFGPYIKAMEAEFIGQHDAEGALGTTESPAGSSDESDLPTILPPTESDDG